MRLSLRELEQSSTPFGRPAFWDELWERYVQSKLDYRSEASVLKLKTDQGDGSIRTDLPWTPAKVSVHPLAFGNEPNGNSWSSPTSTMPYHLPVDGTGYSLKIRIEQTGRGPRALVATQHSMMTLREAASYLRIPAGTLEQLAVESKIPALLLEGRWRFPKSGIDEWVMLQSFRDGEASDAA